LSKHTNEKGRRKSDWRNYKPAVGIAIVSLLICGLFYPLLITGIAQATMPYQANGELVTLSGRTVGSNLIDNGFSLPIFFHARNETNPLNASASRVDPDITLPEAYNQIPRINNASGIPIYALTSIVDDNKLGTFWVFGSPYVNVLKLNIILIKDYPAVYENFSAVSSS
jgi:K+-transporting ATPase ATPase C chain